MIDDIYDKVDFSDIKVNTLCTCGSTNISLVTLAAKNHEYNQAKSSTKMTMYAFLSCGDCDYYWEPKRGAKA